MKIYDISLPVVLQFGFRPDHTNMEQLLGKNSRLLWAVAISAIHLAV